jgi:hypothetical protein
MKNGRCLQQRSVLASDDGKLSCLLRYALDVSPTAGKH